MTIQDKLESLSDFFTEDSEEAHETLKNLVDLFKDNYELEDDYDAAIMKQAGEEDICPYCSGTGEGSHEDSLCSYCNARGSFPPNLRPNED